MNLISIVRELAKSGLIEPGTVEAFNALRLARNSATHAADIITMNNAKDFVFTAERLKAVFELVRKSL